MAEALDPLMLELFRRLPPPGAPWPKEDQVLWLRVAIAITDLIYGPTSPPIHISMNAARGAAVREERRG